MKNIFFSVIFIFALSSFHAGAQKVHHWETAVFNSDIWKYLVPASEPSAQWRSLSFDDTSWLSGPGGFGYNNGDDGTVIWQQGSGSRPYSVYMRIKFEVPDTGKIAQAVLHIDYDDAFVAYLNDVEIARVGLTGTYPPYNQLGVNHDAVMFQGGLPDEFVLDKSTLRRMLRQGTNVLAIQVHNSSVNSSDMSSNAFLSFGIKDTSVFFRKTPSWFWTPSAPSELLSNLPLILITAPTTIPDEPKVTADMKIIHYGDGYMNSTLDEPNVYIGKIGIERRGSSSYNYPQRPYSLETRDELGQNLDVLLLDMPVENDWLLLSNYNEKSFARNILSFEIFTRMGHYAPRVRLAEMIMNNDYQGVYLFGEKVKRSKSRVDISKLAAKDTVGIGLTGGYIFKTDYDDGYGTYWTSNFSPVNRPGGTVRYVYHDPKADEMTWHQKGYIADYVNMLESVLYGADFKNPLTGFRAYIDVNSFIDYFILGEISRNVDAYKKSRYFYKDKDTKSNLVKTGPPWDFDWAWKNLYDCSFLSNTTGSGWAYKINECNVSPVPPSWEVRMLQDPLFANAINNRYFSLRKNLLSEATMFQIIDSVANLVKDAQVRHYNKFKTLGYSVGAPEIEPASKTYAEEVQKLKNWISVRLAWLDANMVGTKTAITQITSNTHLRIFPNPVQDYLFVESNENIKQISIYNLTGNEIISISPDITETQIQLNNLSKGAYLITVKLSDGSQKSQKLIKN